MDISKASNFERFVFDLMDRDAVQILALWAEVGVGEGFDLNLQLDKIRHRYGFVSGKSLHQDRLATIAAVYQTDGELIDPHTADGIKVAREVREPGELVVCLETALAAKFEKPFMKPWATKWRCRARRRWRGWRACRSVCRCCPMMLLP